MTPSILVLIAMAAVAVLAAVAYVVMDRGGQLVRFEADIPPLDLPADRPVTGADIARMRLPLALWGYHVRAVDEALAWMASALQERDDRIAELERHHAAPGDHGRLSDRVAHDQPSGARQFELTRDGVSPTPYEEGAVRIAPADDAEDNAPTRPQ